jgi:hypothetical protein
MTESIQKFWNLRLNDFNGFDILQLINILIKQESTISLYKMNDPRYQISLNKIVSTFCIRTFNNTMPMVLEVLDKMKTDFDIGEDKICTSHAPTDLFKFISAIFDSYKTAPFPEIAKAFLSLIFK